MYQMSLRRSAIVGIALLLTLALAACQGGQTQSPAAAAETTAVQAPTEAATETATEAATEAAVTATEEAAGAQNAETDAAAATTDGGTALQFQIVPEGTEARFLIDEVLMGQPKTVVGTTSQVSGGITVDPANPAVVYAGGHECSVWRSADRGEHWSRVRGFNFKAAQRVIPDPHDPAMIYVTTYGGSVWHGPAEGDANAVEDIVTPEIAFSASSGESKPAARH